MNNTLTIPAPDKWLTANASTNRGHWHRQRLAKTWRDATAAHARAAKIAPFITPVVITGTTIKATRHLYDVDGAVATLKACIDGLRDAGVLAGDDWRYVREVRSAWGEPDGQGARLELRIESA